MSGGNSLMACSYWLLEQPAAIYGASHRSPRIEKVLSKTNITYKGVATYRPARANNESVHGALTLFPLPQTSDSNRAHPLSR